MSNLVKSFSLVCNEDKRIIDSNEAVTLKLQEIRKKMTEDANPKNGGFSLGLNPEKVEGLLEEDDENVSDVADETSENPEDIIEEAKKQAEEIIALANDDATHIVEVAKIQGEDIKKKAHDEGYAVGNAQAKQEIEQKMTLLENEYEQKKVALEQEYKEKRKNMEPELVDVILDVFSNVTKAVSQDQKGIIMALIDKTLSGVEASNNYIIKVSKEDAPFVRENKENIINNIGRDINIEIVEDISMKKNECIIDTDYGIYDCSLDIQLENLAKAIRILSCTVENK